MPKGGRGGKRTGGGATNTTTDERSAFVWKTAGKLTGGLTFNEKQTAINNFIKRNPGEDYDELLADVDMAEQEIKIAERRFANTPIYFYGSKIPSGYTPVQGATTAPNGFEIYSNNQSRFSGNRKTILVAIPDYWRSTSIPLF